MTPVVNAVSAGLPEISEDETEELQHFFTQSVQAEKPISAGRRELRKAFSRRAKSFRLEIFRLSYCFLCSQPASFLMLAFGVLRTGEMSSKDANFHPMTFINEHSNDEDTKVCKAPTDQRLASSKWLSSEFTASFKVFEIGLHSDCCIRQLNCTWDC